MAEAHIYTLADPETNLIRYVGKTVRKPAYRLQAHLVQTENPHKRNWILKLRGRGLVPNLEVIEICGDDWAEREQYWIALYRWLGYPILNATDGGEGVLGYIQSEESRNKKRLAMIGRKMSPETREKMRAAAIGRKLSPETCKKMSEIRKANPCRFWLGKPRSTEDRKKMSNAKRGKPNGQLGMKRSPGFCEKMRMVRMGRSPSQQTRQRMSAAQIGRTASEETRKKLRDAWKRREPTSTETRTKISNTLKGKSHTLETRKKISESLKRRWAMSTARIGRKHTEDEKKKISNALRGNRNATQHHRDAMV